jgi:PAS domain S-box-containing protein
MKLRTRHIAVNGKIFLLLASVSIILFSGVVALATAGLFEQPLQVLVIVAGLLALMSAVIFVGIWLLVLRPVSGLADNFVRSRGDLSENPGDELLFRSGDTDIFKTIENRAKELVEVVQASELSVIRTKAVFAQIQSNSSDNICRIDANGHFVLCDAKFADTLGYKSPADLVSATGNSFPKIFRDPSVASDFLDRMTSNKEVGEKLAYIRRSQGTVLCMDLNAREIRDHTNFLLYYQINLTDASRLATMADDLEKAEHFQKLFSSWIDLLADDAEEADLTTDFCRLLVDKGGYVLAWIGAASDGVDNDIRPLAMYGHNMGFVHGIQNSWAADKVEFGLVNSAIRSGMPGVVRDVQGIEEFKSQRRDFVERDIKSVVALPIRVGQVSSSAIVIYAKSATAFASNEINWLVDLTSSLSMGIMQLRDRKILTKAEKARLHAEQNYRTVFDNAAEGMIQLSSDLQVINANMSASRILGFDSIEELLRHGENIGRNLMARHSRAQNSSADDDEVNIARRFEVAWIRRDNKQIWLSLNLQPRFDSDGKIAGYDGVLVDFTEERQAESDLRNLSRAVEQSPVAVVITDNGGNIEYVNEKFSVVSGYPREEVLGRKPSFLKSGYTSDAEYEYLWRTISSGGEWQGEFHNRRKNGELFWEAASISPILDAQGRITHFLGVKEDITEAKAADEAIRQAGAHLETILNNVLEGIVSADEKGQITGFNAAAEVMFGYSAEQAIGQDIRLLAGESSPGDLHRRIIDSFRFEQNSPYIGHIIEVAGQHADGSRFPLEISVGIALTQNSRVFLGTYRDISERKKIERERQELGERLVNSQKLESIGQLAGGIAHDFNNILTPIVGYVELAKRNVQDDTLVHKDLLRIERSARRARELTTKILNFSRPTATEVQPANFAEIVAEAVDMIRIAAGSNVEVIWANNIASSIVIGDPSQLSQIAMNLVTNAQQALGDDEGRIEVSLKPVSDADRSELHDLKYQSGDYIMLRVEDTGPGMDEETRARIFEPFYTTKSTGTGLGMATVMSIINGLKGEIDVVSHPGSGTRIDVYLPLASPVKVAPGQQDEAVELIEGNEHILFVDDEPEHTDLARRMLENYGYSVTPMIDSEEALNVFKGRPDDFDIVITDQMMPKMSGHELALAMWEMRPDLPIVAISGYSKNVSEQNARKLGYRDFLAKPFDLLSLVTVVRRSLDSQKNGDQGDSG